MSENNDALYWSLKLAAEEKEATTRANQIIDYRVISRELLKYYNEFVDRRRESDTTGNPKEPYWEEIRFQFLSPLGVDAYKFWGEDPEKVVVQRCRRDSTGRMYEINASYSYRDFLGMMNAFREKSNDQFELMKQRGK